MGTSFSQDYNSQVQNQQQEYVVQCYAPTNDADDATKQDFYNLLQAVLDTAKQKDLVFLMGDFNAKVGEDNKGYETIMGQQLSLIHI